MIYTFGYGNRQDHDYLRQCISDYCIPYLMDIRLEPERAWSGKWRSKSLRALCDELGVKYSHIWGLGNLGKKKYCFNPPNRKRADEDILMLSRLDNILLLCAELKPDGCHRSIVAQEISAINGQEIKHF